MSKLNLATLVAVGSIFIASIGTAPAQSRHERDRRNDKQNEWKNLSIGGGALGVIGLLTKNNTLTYLGIGGGLYSLYRYEEDRKSSSREARQRAELFNRKSFTHKGKRYVRKVKVKNGQKYYYFARR